jgi:hypothetical protein
LRVGMDLPLTITIQSDTKCPITKSKVEFEPVREWVPVELDDETSGTAGAALRVESGLPEDVVGDFKHPCDDNIPIITGIHARKRNNQSRKKPDYTYLCMGERTDSL